MADKTTSSEASGAPAQGSDEVRIARSGSNFKLTIDQLVGAQVIDITWANFVTAYTGSALAANKIYHITNAVDGSTVITEAWFRSLTTSKFDTEGLALMTTGTITARACHITVNPGAAAGDRLLGYSDSLGNKIDAANRTVLDRWLNILTASNADIQVCGGSLAASPSGTIGDGSYFGFGASLDLKNSSFIQGRLELGGSATIGANATTSLNSCQVWGSITCDNGNNCTSIMVGLLKNLDLSAVSIFPFSTEQQNVMQSAGSNPTGDTVTVDPNTGILFIEDGSTDITINLADGLFNGQRLTIIFRVAQSATTWGGNFEGAFFPSASPGGAPYKIEAIWHSVIGKWH